MKLTIACFGNISSKKELAPLSYYNYSLLHDLNNQGLVNKIYCLEYDETVEIPASKIVKFSGTFFSKISYLVSIIIPKIFPNISGRLIMELAFDKFISSQENFSNSTLLLNIKGINLKLYKKAFQKKVPVVMLADVCHPKFIYNEIVKVEQRYGIKDKSAYTSKIRIKYLAKSFEQVDLLIPMVKAKVVYNSFIPYMSPEKIKEPGYLYGVDNNIFRPLTDNEYLVNQDEVIVFFTVNQSGLKKGLVLLLDAWSRLNESYLEKTSLNIAGGVDSPSKDYGGQKLNVKNVNYLGYLPDVYEAYRKADVFIAASVEDLTPRTVIEAMASGLPVIVSSNCGLADYITDGVDGWIYDPFDVDKLNNLIIWCLGNKEALRNMGLNARNKAITFTFHQYNESIINNLNNFSKGN